MAQWFGVPQPDIIRWFHYWLQQDWRRMLSQQWGEVLTLESQQRVADSWVKFPWWSAWRMWNDSQEQDSALTLKQVQQVGRESGWTLLRQALRRVDGISPDSMRPRDEWLVSQLLSQIQGLVERLEEVEGLTPQQQIELADLDALCDALGLRPRAPRRPLPWVRRLQHLLWGGWEPVDEGRVRCICCGTTDVSRKSRKPRWNTHVDEQGQFQRAEVCRYYCHNPACPYQSFTNLPLSLVPYAQWTFKHHLAALQMYGWSRSVYRCTGQVLGVSKITAYRWVSGFGCDLLPVAALFGVVRSSEVVGVGEKWVKVPQACGDCSRTNDKPEGKHNRWMYVYFAVDGYTYDLLHIEMYPYNKRQSAQAFLLALRAKGYHPRVIVTDMRVDYSALIAQVFPGAIHHECIFHALQQVAEHIEEIYGTDYAQTHPELAALKEEIERLFDAHAKRTAQRRYDKVLAQREQFVAETPEATVLFDFPERHWPKLVNAMESRIVPTTNNATEQVIRIFTQHYKTFCGIENMDSARCYLAVFEKVYRFTPFSDDAQGRIRGKCPLELASYEVQKLPMAQLFRGLALRWPVSASRSFSPMCDAPPRGLASNSG